MFKNNLKAQLYKTLFPSKIVLGNLYFVELEKTRMPLKRLVKILRNIFICILLSYFYVPESIMIPLFTIGLFILSFVLFRSILLRMFPRKFKRPFQENLELFIEGNSLDITLAYCLKIDRLEVIVGKEYGNHSMASQLGSALETSLNLSVYDIEETKKVVTYSFLLKEVERNNADSMVSTVIKDTRIEIYDDIVLDMRKNTSSLISGVSGSGKSVFTYYLIASLLSKRFNQEIDGAIYDVAPSIYVIDPKQSDLWKLENLTMPDKYYGSTISEAFRIVRDFTAELERRKIIYARTKIFDKVMIDLGFPPCVLVIDEYSSLISMMSNKEKNDFENLVGNIARLGRQLSLSLFVIMQQASSNSISTGVREQLVNKFILGNSESISQENSQMVLGVSVKDLPTPFHEVGEGIVSIDGQKPRAFLAPSFTGDLMEVVVPIFRRAAKTYSDIDKLEYLRQSKQNAESIGKSSEEIEYLQEYGKTYDKWE